MKIALKPIAIAAFGLLIIALVAGCGGSSSTPQPKVQSSSSLAQVDAGGQAMLTSTVTNDSGGKGVTFGAPTCGTPPPAGGCGTVTNVQIATANGSSTTTATYNAPASDLNVSIPVTLNATSAAETPIAITVAADPTISASVTATIGQACPVLVSNGTPPYMLSVTSGSLPAWATFNTTTGVLCTGNVPNNATSSSFSAKVTDSGDGSTGASAITVTVTVPIVITTASPLATGEVSQAGYNTGALVFVGGSGAPAAANPWSVTAGGAALTAAGLTFNLSTGAITGPPTAACSPCAFSVQVKDSLGATSAATPFNLTIVPQVAVAAPTSGLSATIGTQYSLTLAASAGTGQAPYSNWAVSSGQLPAGLSLNASTGVISAAAGPTDAATTPSFTVTAKDSLGVTSAPSAPITISVAIPITAASLPGGEVSAAYNSGAPAANTGTGTGITWSATGLPTWASINPATGAITGAAPTMGSSTPTLTVTDANHAAGSKQLTLTINPQLTITSSGMLMPNGIVNVPYNGGSGVQLASTGGVAPLGNWTGPVTGSLPTGLSVSSSGVVQGTPQCPTVTNLPFTVHLGPDADGVIATSPTLTITTTTTALAINAVSMQQESATVGTAYSLQLGTSGGVCNPTVTWSVVAGSLPADGWLTLNTSTGLLSGTPAAADVGTVNITVQATDGTSSPQLPLSITVAASHSPGPNAGQLSGTYAFQLRGFDSSGSPIAMAGSFTAHGDGTFSAGVMDVNSLSGGPSTNLTINLAQSFYSVGADERGSMTLSTTAGTYTFDLSAGDLFTPPPLPPPLLIHVGHIISSRTNSPHGFAVSGVFASQTTPIALSAMAGDYAFSSEGSDSSGKRVATAGRQTLDTSGSITNGEIDINNGVPLGLSFTGSVDNAAATPIDPNTGRGTLTLTMPLFGTLHLAFYVLSTNELYLVSTDLADSTHYLYASHGLRQSTTYCPTTGNCNFATNPAPLSGNSIVYIQGLSSTAGASRVQIGNLLFTSTGAGTGTLSGGFDQNDGGTISTASSNPVSGDYTITANGRVTFTNAGATPPILYMIGANNAFVVGTSSRVDAGTGEPQSIQPFTMTGGEGGYYCFGTEAPAVSGSKVFDGVQQIIPSSATTAPVSGYAQDFNSLAGGLQEDVASSNVTLTADSTGRFTFSDGTNGTSPKVGYIVGFNGMGEFNKSIAIDTDPSDTMPFIIINDRVITEIMLE